uniref:3-ketoacyl-[acyl-carrier-protein] reductase beta subunit n=1 Tax=Salmo trutta TaxID=8032 RepID=A0A673X721_SALTR
MSRLCVVCGGSRGIGRAVSRLLVERGSVIFCLPNAKSIFHVLADHVGFCCDVSKGEEVQKTFRIILKTCGNISYLVNAARDGLLLWTRLEDMVAMLHTNLLGSMLSCKAALRSMLHTQGVAIVNIGSVVELKGNAGQCVYSASKAGLEGFSRSLANKVASRNIRVNLLAPCFLGTDMTAGLGEGYGPSVFKYLLFRNICF